MFIPDIIVKGLGVAIYALFVALIVPSCKKSTQAILVALSTGLLNTFMQSIFSLNQSSGFIVSVISVSVLATIFSKKEVK